LSPLSLQSRWICLLFGLLLKTELINGTKLAQ
jgi:hypothetical protein